MKITLIFISSLWLAGCSSSSNSDGGLLPKVQQKAQSCADFRASLPANIASSFADVPERPGDPSSPKIKVFFYYHSPIKGRVTLFLNGGPGSSSHSSFWLMEKTVKSFGLNDKMTFVYMDQRGTGCSSGYPAASTDDEMFESGKWYGTRGIVNDAEVIRQQLVGNKPWSIFGQSYGAMIAHRYVTIAPQSLDRVVAYANTITPDNRMRLSDRMASQVDVWTAYDNVYPGDRDSIALLTQALTLSVCAKIDDQNDCGLSLLDSLAGSYLGFHDEWPKLHTWFGKLVVNGAVQIDQVTRLATLFSEPYSLARSRNLNAVNYYDRDVRFLNGSSCEVARSDWALTRPGVEFGSFLTECSGPLQNNWNTNAYDRVARHFGGAHDTLTFNDLRPALAARARNFFLLYSADLDPYVPARSFVPEVQALGDVLTYRNFTDVGHDGFYTKREVFDDFLAP